ncbi:PKD domain-containing protein [Hymenobacter sp. ASUV-10]|uniref:PKD domain-containing protein n=1 Tax=Hymenobacter aranciens TaxID=3063996 RepID=A0ABT9B7Z3_9BACT|nr:PKD domain-containing protein [Hymenobacter sp. ASUV-10]MDO7873132.1 PKD domain-containing protein [Hymenobacter sp. ASUV-10]
MNTLLQLGFGLVAIPALANTPTVVGPAPSPTVEFVANQRQWEKPVLFAADVPGGRLYLERGRLLQSLYDARQIDELHHHKGEVSTRQSIKAHAYATTFVGANPQARVGGESQLPGYSNYFLGNDKNRWASNVPGYGEVRYAALYPGIDLHFYSKELALEYDFEVKAGADAGRIALRYDGQTSLRLVDGALHIGTSVGTVVEQRPYAYQLVDGKRIKIACEYAIGSGNTVRFSLPKGYNKALPLVIDPVLSYATYTGSSANNYGYTATYDAAGNLYSGGTVFSAGYPTTVGAYSTTFAGVQDIGIMKFNPNAATGPASRVYATYLGGGSDDHPHSLVVDGNNNLIILGTTSSANFPTTTGAIATTRSGASDITITKLNPAGAALVGSTYFGGTAADGQVSGTLNQNYGDAYRGDITIDRNNNIYLAAITQSTNYPTTVGAFQRTSGGGGADGVVSKFNATLTSVVWSSYLGGSGLDAVYSVQLDSINNVFVSGGTTSTNLPGTTGAYHATSQGGTDGFVARIAPDGSALVRTTYLGTSAYDQAYLLQLNKRGEVYAYGQTLGAYPVSAGIYTNANSRQFIHKLNPTLTTSVFSTVVGNGGRASGSHCLSPTAFLVDNCGQIIIAGWGGTSLGESTIAGLPVTAGAIQATGPSGDNHYIMQLSANAQTLVYGTYFGNGSCHADGGTSRFDKSGVIYQAMCVGTGSGAIQTTPNAWSRTKGTGSYNNGAFKIDVLQLNANFIPAITATSTTRQADLCSPAQFYFNRPSTTGTSVLWNFGNGQTSTQTNNATTTYTSPGRYAVSLTVFDTNGCLPSVTTIDTVVVYPVPAPRVAVSSRQTICIGNPATLSASNIAAGTPNVSYTWTAPGQPTQTGATITVQPTATTKYTVTLATPGGAGGCSATDTVTVRVLNEPLDASFVPALTATASTRQASQCAPAQFFFNRPAVVGTGVLWDFGNGQTSTLANNATATYSAPGRYPVRLTVTNSNGCGQSRTTVDTVVVYAVPRPQVTPASRALVCFGSATTLTANNLNAAAPNVIYTWTAPGLPTLTGPAITITPAATVQYTVTASTPANAGSCSETDTVTVHVLDRVVVAAGPARDICPGSSVTLSVPSAGPNARYIWTAPGQPTLSGQSVSVQPSASIRYRVVVENQYGCQGRDSVQVNVATRPTLAATVSAANIINEPVTFTNTSTGATSYRWDFGDNSAPSTDINPTHTYTTVSPVPFQARLTAIYGAANCEETIVVPVTVRGFALPNIITPNNDGKNDTFRPFVTTESVKIQVFNRWGRLVYENANYVDGWGADAAAGTYYYYIVNTSGDSWKGWVEVVR